MAMASGSTGSVGSDINVTPLIDILLVLLIVFMVIVPIVPRGLEANTPQPSKMELAPSAAIVVSVLHGEGASPEYRINQDVVAKAALLDRLTAIYANRAERIMFVKGGDDVEFSKIAEVIDVGRSAGVDHVGLMTPKVEQGL